MLAYPKYGMSRGVGEVRAELEHESEHVVHVERIAHSEGLHAVSEAGQ